MCVFACLLWLFLFWCDSCQFCCWLVSQWASYCDFCATRCFWISLVGWLKFLNWIELNWIRSQPSPTLLHPQTFGLKVENSTNTVFPNWRQCHSWWAKHTVIMRQTQSAVVIQESGNIHWICCSPNFKLIRTQHIASLSKDVPIIAVG